jgi:hypothetical protein
MWEPRRITILKASPACYGVSFTLLCIDDVRTLQETHVQACTAGYGIALLVTDRQEISKFCAIFAIFAAVTICISRSFLRYSIV